MERSRASVIGFSHRFGERRVSNGEIERQYGLPEGWIMDKTGKEVGHAWENGPLAPEHAAVECLQHVLDRGGITHADVRAVFGTTNPITKDGITDPVSLTRRFVEVAGFASDIEYQECSFGCGGPAIGIEQMCRWLDRQQEPTYAVYVTQDWSTAMVRDRNVAALFSDAVSVSLWTNDPRKGAYEVVDIFSAHSAVPDSALGIVGGFWEMDGKEVVDAVREIPRIVADRFGIDLQKYDIVPHQANPKLLRTLEQLYDVRMHKATAIEHGNPTCSGTCIAVQRHIEDRESGIVQSDKDILAIPFGAGGMGAFILRKKK